MLLLAGPSPAAARDKTDVVVLVNGDEIHGEIKEMYGGRIRLSTDSMDTIYIDWVDVVSVESEYYFQLEDRKGVRYYGTLAPSEQEHHVLIQSMTGPVDMSRDDLVRITPIEQKWTERWNGKVGFGFSYTKASDVSTYNLYSSGKYRVRKFEVNLSLDSTLTTQTDRPTASRNDVAVGYTRFRRNRWQNSWVTGAQTNTELGLDLRVYAGALGGRNVLQTIHTYLTLSGGLIATEEVTTGTVSARTSLESVLALRHEYSRYKTPKASMLTTLQIFPGLTNWGRVRAEFNTKLSYELVKDFFVDLTGYVTYDNEPISDQAFGDADWGTTLGLSWTF